MFKKNLNRPPITINLRKVNSGYKVISNDSFNPFSFKKITRAIFKNQLQNSKGPDALLTGTAPNEAFTQQPFHTTIPLSAKWFDFDSINDIEKEAFQQFFLDEDEDGRLFKKSPRLYKFYRNFIILLWRENSKKHLSPSICRKNLPGDVSAIIRIHAFLQHWGLINFPSKEHAKGYVQAKPKQFFCHSCQWTKTGDYYLCRLDQQNLLQLCDCCYQNQIYPQFLKSNDFKKISHPLTNALEKKIMKPQQIQKMLEITASQTYREKDLWNNLALAFPSYSKEQIIHNFLLIPSNHKMNANIFHNNEDSISDDPPPSDEDPTIFQDYQNQEQICIANSYYLWNKSMENRDLTALFHKSSQQCRYLASIQKQKCCQMIRMLIDVQQSKLELKSIFIQELQKIVGSQIQCFQTTAANFMAEELKNRQIDIQ